MYPAVSQASDIFSTRPLIRQAGGGTCERSRRSRHTTRACFFSMSSTGASRHKMAPWSAATARTRRSSTNRTRSLPSKTSTGSSGVGISSTMTLSTADLTAKRRTKYSHYSPNQSAICVYLKHTFDNDILFLEHKRLERILRVKIYFCHPRSPWEKPSVENFNKWLRRYVPKSSDISRYSRYVFKQLEDKANRRFMDVLKFHTPDEMYAKALKHKQRPEARSKTKN